MLVIKHRNESEQKTLKILQRILVPNLRKILTNFYVLGKILTKPLQSCGKEFLCKDPDEYAQTLSYIHSQTHTTLNFTRLLLFLFSFVVHQVI